MNLQVKEFVHDKLAKLLDHLYFQETKSSVNIIIIMIFFIQKITLLLWSNSQENLKEQELYFSVGKQFFYWITFQKPLKILDSISVNELITIGYTILQLGMFLVFCFSLYKWQFISKFFSFYISNYQLLILYHCQIHVLNQQYSLSIKILYAIPLYINYLIIVYCSRNFFILSQQHMLRRYSLYNYVIVINDFINYLLFEILTDSSKLYAVLAIYIIYFIDSIIYKPYCSKINVLYQASTSILVISAVIKMVNLSKLTSTISIELIIYLGEIINHSSKKSIERRIGDNIIAKISQYKNLNAEAILNVLEMLESQIIDEQRQMIFLKKSFDNKKEEIQLYITFLNHSIKGSYLQCLLQTKKFLIENKTHSLFYQVISSLISQKYDKQVENLGKTGSDLTQKNHQKLVFARQFQLFYLHNIKEVLDILDQKIVTWNSILQGFAKIDDALDQIIILHKLIAKVKDKHAALGNKSIRFINSAALQDLNALVLRYFSFFWSYIENDFLSAFIIEKQIDIFLNQERDRIVDNAVNTAILKKELIMISASVLQDKGAIVNKDSREISIFFSLELQQNSYIANINQLMPRFIHDKHALYVDQFIQRGGSELYHKCKLVFGAERNGFIFPLELSFLHINEKSSDFILTAILKKASSSSEYILFDESGEILGISRKIFQLITESKTINSTASTFGDTENQINGCFIQIWIPSIMNLIISQHIDINQSTSQQNIEFFIFSNYKTIIEGIKGEIQKNGSKLTQDQINNLVQSYHQTNTNIHQMKKLLLEVDLMVINIPNNEKYYCLEFQTLTNDIVQLPGINNIHPIKSLKYKKELKQKLLQDSMDEFLITKRTTDNQQLIPKDNEKKKQENLDPNIINFSDLNHENFRDIDQSFQTKKNLVNQQAFSHSSKGSNNSNLQVYEAIKKIVQNTKINSFVKTIFIISLIQKTVLILLSSAIIEEFYLQNQFLQKNVDLVKYPDQFNRLYCSFTTMGQIDLERSLLGADYGEYVFYRIRLLSGDLINQMEDQMINFKNQFSVLQEKNKLQNLTIRIMNYFSYQEEQVMMMQFDSQVEGTSNTLNQLIQSNLQYSNDSQFSIIDEYFQLQFLKGNLINQIISSQTLIDEIIIEINNSKAAFQQILLILLFVQIVLICILSFAQTYFWRMPYQQIKMMLQLITFSSDQFIYKSIERAKLGKQLILSDNWQQTNYFHLNFSQIKKEKLQNDKLNQQDNQNKKQIKITQRINHQQFQFRYVYLQTFLLFLLLQGLELMNYMYLTNTQKSSQPEMELALGYVQFKQDWDSLMIISYLLKTNSVLTEKVLELGFLDKNSQLKNQSLYFHTVYTEMLKIFSQNVPQSKDLNQLVFSGIINSSRLLESDKSKLFDLYENDLCLTLMKQLPFCNYQNGVFENYPDYPAPFPEDNNREIFKNGINGIFQKILIIFQSQYELELINVKNYNQTENLIYLQSQDFRLFILQYFFDINKAVVEFYTTILLSMINILELDFQNSIYFQIFTKVSIYTIETLLLIYFLSRLEFLIQVSRTSITMLPQECFRESKCLMIIKKITND